MLNELKFSTGTHRCNWLLRHPYEFFLFTHIQLNDDIFTVTA